MIFSSWECAQQVNESPHPRPQAHFRRYQLQNWLQKIGAQPLIVQGEIFQNFLLNAQKEVQKGWVAVPLTLWSVLQRSHHLGAAAARRKMRNSRSSLSTAKASRWTSCQPTRPTMSLKR